MKKQFALADKQGITFCVVIGEDEAVNKQCILKNMTNGEQVVVSIDTLATEVKQRLA